MVIRPTRRLDSKRARAVLGARKIRFATADELMELTGLVPGSVPPFGAPVLAIELYLDASIDDDPKVAFNAGDTRVSIILATEDYLRVVGDPARSELSR